MSTVQNSGLITKSFNYSNAKWTTPKTVFKYCHISRVIVESCGQVGTLFVCHPEFLSLFETSKLLSYLLNVFIGKLAKQAEENKVR